MLHLQGSFTSSRARKTDVQEEKRPHLPLLPLLPHSLTSCFSHSSSLFFPLGRKSSMFYCLSFSSFWHSHISKLLLPTLSHTSGSVKSQFVWQRLKRFHIVLWVLLFCLFFHRRPNCTEVHYGVQTYEGSEEKKEIGRRLSAACLLSEVSGVM